jgi:hypothetical protein
LEEPASQSGAAGPRFVTQRHEADPDKRPGDVVLPSRGERDLAGAWAQLSAGREREERPEPIVKVTIGRVEVRAVIEPPKAPARAHRAASRAIPLDKYLERHEERRR